MAKQRICMKFTNPLIILPILLCLLLLYVPYVVELNFYSLKFKGEDIKIDNIHTGFVIKTTGCRIPSLEPFDKSILKFLFKVKPFVCSNILPLVQSTLDSVYIDDQHLFSYNVSNQYTVDCCYQPFWREDPNSNSADNLYRIGNCTNFKSTKINDEFIKVICQVNKTEIYKDFYSFVPIKRKTIKPKGKLNILIFGLDSISRLNFYRQMPLTKAYLEKLNSIELIGYNKVGDNTFPNLIPILTGQSVEEIKNGCWPTEQTKFDECDFIWKNYSKQGYLTAFTEDSSWMGLFNYQKRGFAEQPTDYYWRTFNYLAEKEIGHTKTYNSDLCIGPRATYRILLDYIEKFTLSLRNESYFGFFWGTSLSHDALNYPQLGDKHYKQFLETLNRNHILDDTLLIFLSDHGMRWGDIRSTHQGHLEERLPFFYFVFPEWFREKYPSAITNLRRNTRRLTTPFDFHETLKDLLNTELLTAENIKQRSTGLYNSRGISLFLAVPENRTCSSANISAHWCTCQQSTEIDTSNSVVQKAADFIVAYMNNLLKGYNSCATLVLDGILNARLSASADYLKNNRPIHDYSLVLKTKPGGGLFEATVRCVDCEKNNTFDLTGTISRINLYGNQSTCIAHYHLKLYCYCAS